MSLYNVQKFLYELNRDERVFAVGCTIADIAVD